MTCLPLCFLSIWPFCCLPLAFYHRFCHCAIPMWAKWKILPAHFCQTAAISSFMSSVVYINALALDLVLHESIQLFYTLFFVCIKLFQLRLNVASSSNDKIYIECVGFVATHVYSNSYFYIAKAHSFVGSRNVCQKNEGEFGSNVDNLEYFNWVIQAFLKNTMNSAIGVAKGRNTSTLKKPFG